MFLQLGDLLTHVLIDGPHGAPDLVMLHSLGTNVHVWDRQVEVLKAKFKITRADLRGHGLSSATPGPYTLEGLAADIRALMDALEIKTAHVAGISIGGMVAQALTALAPERVTSLSLVDTALKVGPPELWLQRAAAVRTGGMGVIADAVLGRWVTPANAASPMARGLRHMLERTPAEGYAGGAEALAVGDCTATSARIAKPALVLVGEQDLATPVASAQALSGAIAGSKLVVIPGAAHIATLEQPGPVTAALQAFLEPFA